LPPGHIGLSNRAEALTTIRLSEICLEPKLENTFRVRFGQLAADAEFFIASPARRSKIWRSSLGSGITY